MQEKAIGCRAGRRGGVRSGCGRGGLGADMAGDAACRAQEDILTYASRTEVVVRMGTDADRPLGVDT